MLELVIGCSGSGKSEYVLEQLDSLTADSGRPIILLVPEQASFEHERSLLCRLGGERAARVQVLGFSRLADTVFREVGGFAEQNLDEASRALLMSRALEQVAAAKEDLGEPMTGLYARRDAQSAYISRLLLLWQEMKQSGVPTDELERVAAELSADERDSLLSEKTAELYQVFTAYEGLSAATGLDELDKLNRLAEKLADSRLPDGAAVFVDGFKGFTAPESAVLEGMLGRADRLVVTLGTDTPGIGWDGITPQECLREMPLFSPVTDTVKSLRRMAERHGMTWQLRHLTDNHRTADEVLKALESRLYAPSPIPYEGTADSVTVTACADIYEECAYVARCVRRLLREEGYRCRDITLVARNLSDYQGVLEDALEQQGVPCYMDARRDLLSEPLVVYARGALHVAVDGWHTEDILRLLKTDLGPLEPLETAELENYVYMWRIDGVAWEREWTDNPEGLDAAVTPFTAQTLARLNGWRRRVMEPLMALRRALRGRVTGHGFALAMYTYLSGDGELSRRVAAQCARLEDLSESLLAAHSGRLWDEMMAVLDRFASTLGDQVMAASRLEELFTMLCELVDMGTLPQGLDVVTVGSADRIRYTAPRAVFVLGANEGVFPAYPSADGVFTELERRRLKGMHLELAGDTLRQCVEERYYVYTAVAAPSERLFVTYPTDGEAVASPLIAAIDTILPRHAVGTSCREDAADLECGEEMFRRLAEDCHRPTAVKAALRQVLATDDVYAPRLAAVEHSVAAAPFRLEDRQVARSLFGTDMCLSASRTESFYQCHFSYYCKYGLRLRPRRVAQIDAGIFGNIVHYVMETLLPEYTVKDGLVDELKAADAALTAEQLRATETRRQAELMTRIRPDVQRVTETYVQETMGGTEGKSGRFLYQVGQARRAAANMLWHTVTELRQSAFTPVDFELNIHAAEDDRDGIFSLRLPYAEGTVQMVGKIDRVDLYTREDGTAFVRVVDYKTGAKTFDINAVAEGLSMQMLLYLFILCDNSRRYLEEGRLRPAGVLYHPLSDLVVDRREDNRKRLESMRMSGLVLDDRDVVQAMEAEAQNVYVPAQIDAGGEVKGSVATAAQFALLRRLVENLVTAMAQSLLDGDIETTPLQSGRYTPCDFCDYRAVCGREDTAPVRSLGKRSLQEILEDVRSSDEASDEAEEVTADGGERVE